MPSRPCNHCEESRCVRLLADSGTYAELAPSKLPHLHGLETIPCPECTARCAICRDVVLDVDLDAAGWCAECADALQEAV